MEQALRAGSPFVFINDSGGARVQEGIDSLSGYGRVFYTNVMLSGAVPQVSIICGPCAGRRGLQPRRSPTSSSRRVRRRCSSPARRSSSR